MKTLIHPTAVIHPDAQLHPTVQVGPYAVIGEEVKVGAETVIGAHVVLEGPTEIGVGNQIYPGAAIGLESQDKKFQGGATYLKIGDRNTIREYVTINRATGAGDSTLIGNGNLIMAYVHVAHDCVIEDNVVIANSVGLAGHVHIESQAVIGGLVGIHQFVHIGRLAMIGGMSRIDRDVPPYTLVEGNPSRVRSLNLIGFKRAGMSTEEIAELKKAFRILYDSGLLLNQALEQLAFLPNYPHVEHLRQFLNLSQMPERRGSTPGEKVTKRKKDEAAPKT